MKFLFYLLAKLHNKKVFYLVRSIFITKTISTIKLGLYKFKKIDSKKKPTPKSGKNCYEKESDVRHHCCKSNTNYDINKRKC